MYANNFEAQKLYQNKLEKTQEKEAQKIKDSKNVELDLDTIKFGIHFLGASGFSRYVDVYRAEGERRADEIFAYGDPKYPDIKPIGGPNSSIPNRFVSDHLFDFTNTTPTPFVNNQFEQNQKTFKSDSKSQIPQNKSEIKKELKSRFNFDITENKLDILLDPQKSYNEKARILNLPTFGNSSTIDDLSDKSNILSYVNRQLIKSGFIEPDFTEVIKTETDYKSDVKSTGVTYLGEVKGEVGNYGTFINKFDRNTGFNYIPIKNYGKSKKSDVYDNVLGIAHFLLDSDLTDGYKHEYSKNYVQKQLQGINIAGGSTVKDQFLPVYEKNKNGTVNIKYKKVSEIVVPESPYSLKHTIEKKKSEIAAPLRQYRFTDLNWEGKTDAKGFKSNIKAIPTKTGEQTFFIFPNNENGKFTYGKFGGASVVFLSDQKEFAVDFSGSITDIKNMAEKIILEENIEPENLIIAYHDVGSFSAKPKAIKNKLSFKQWSGFNFGDHTGGGLAFPSN